MQISFEPGDGSFEITLESDEPIRPEDNVKGVCILRKKDNGYIIVKSYDELL